MTTVQHTQGQWYTCGWSKLGVNVHQDNGDHWTICMMVGGGDPVSGQIQEWQANARLIAAAPELLEMVEELVGHVRTSENYGIAEKARAVIAKARGET